MPVARVLIPSHRTVCGVGERELSAHGYRPPYKRGVFHGRNVVIPYYPAPPCPMAKCSLEIKLDCPDRTYKPGEKITGTVVVTVGPDCRCRKITLTPTWTTRGGGIEDSASAEGQVLPGAVWHDVEEVSYPFKFRAKSHARPKLRQKRLKRWATNMVGFGGQKLRSLYHGLSSTSLSKLRLTARTEFAGCPITG
jgi:hypothetical protein